MREATMSIERVLMIAVLVVLLVWLISQIG